MVFNATFNNYISLIWWWLVFFYGENSSILGKTNRPVATLSHNVLSSTPRYERGSNSQR